MSTLKVNNLQVGQDSTPTNNLTWFQPGTPDGTIRLGSGNAGSATSKFTFDKDGHLTCVGNITANSIIAPIEGTLDDWIVHAGDTNTKFGFPADDKFTVETAGTERFRIDDSGRIGIDYTPASGDGPFNVDVSGSNNIFHLGHGTNNDNYYTTGASGTQYFRTPSANQLVIKSDGKIGIGTAAPASILHVAGGSSPTILNKPSDASPAYFVGDSNRTSAGQHLAEFKGRWNGNDVARIVFLAGADTSNKDDGDIRIDTTPSGGNPTERVRITSAGDIEIGTQAAHSNTLKFADSSRDDAVTMKVDNSDDSDFDIVNNRNSGDITVATNSAEIVRIDSTGRLLKSGQAALTSTSLSHLIQVAAASDANAIAIIGRASDDIGELSYYEADKSTKLGELQYRRDHLNLRHRVGYMSFATGGTTERVRITSDGHTLFSGLTSNVDTRNAKGISVKSPDGITFRNFGANGSRNWRIRPDDNHGWSDLEFNCAPTDGANDIPDHASDVVLALEGDTRDVTVANGNLKIGTNGKGIDFSSNTDDESGAGSISSELLDDYEVGTWVPTYTSSNATFGYSTQEGWYIKVGKLVTVRAYIRTSSVSSTSHSLLKMSGLPFQVAKRTPCSVRAWGFQGSGYDQFPTVATFEHNQTFLEFLKYSSGGTSDYTTSTMNNDTSVVICGSYKVD